MKRILALTLAIMLAFSLITTAGAEDTKRTITSPGGTGNTDLTYTVAQAFTVTIPASVAIASDTKIGSGEVNVTSSTIPFGKSLTVTITDATNYDTKFRLKDGTNENYIDYSIKIGETTVAMGAAFLTVAAGTPSGSATLIYTADPPTIAGTYTDQLTFTVAVAQ